ncbi:MAG TPA: hypothetical protein PKH75_13170 [Bacillota bacterium]|nr:hypothetical protein [Bacillota bacterium]
MPEKTGDLSGVQLLLPFSDLIAIRDGDQDARRLYDRHYSARHYRDGRRPKKIMGPGEYLLLTTPDRKCLVGFRVSNRPIGVQEGIYLSIFRNESDRIASKVLRLACQLAFSRWPAQSTIFTFVNPKKVKKNGCPGYCFLRAGFRRIGRTQRGLIVMRLQRHQLR